MNIIEEENLRVEIAHIFESGANEARIFEMVKNFIERRMQVNKSPMEILYEEMQERLKYLEAQDQTEEIKWRIQEVSLAIVKLQQIILNNGI